MTRSLDTKSSLEALRKEAKRWLKAVRAGEVVARRRYEAAHPHGPTLPTLRAIQHALAHEHGFESWAALRAHIDDLETARRSHAERVADFLELACLHYGVAPGSRSYTGYPEDPERRRRAARILERHPEVARESLHTAVVCGDLEQVVRMLANRPEAAREKGGREGWDPLLFLCYGRLPIPAVELNAVEIATALLDHGADPNTAWSYDWDDRPMTMSALGGVIGEGEGGPVICPPHAKADALAARLLDRGADPNQGQALYNTMLRGDADHWLRVLIGRGLGPRHPIAWDRGSGTSIFEYLLGHAVAMNQLKRAAVLLENGASATPSKGRSFYERALLGGNLEMAELLARHGAERSELTGREAFRAACMRLDRLTAEGLLAGHAGLLDEARTLLVDEAAKRDLVEVARLLLDLGVSPDADHEGPDGRYRALHQAACVGSIRVAELLIQRGANVDARDTGARATPLGWALHTQTTAAIELLARYTRDVFTVVAGGCAERLRALLTQDPTLANATVEQRIGLGITGADPGETPLFVLPGDEDLAIEVADLLLAFGADPNVRNRAGQTAADKARERGLEDAADWLTTRQLG